MISSPVFFCQRRFRIALVGSAAPLPVQGHVPEILYGYTVLSRCTMSPIHSSQMTVSQWYHFLQDVDALLRAPTKHHRELLHQAYALRDAHVVDAGTLAEMLELADEALVYAHEASAAEHW